jgi:hypothetical protein
MEGTSMIQTFISNSGVRRSGYRRAYATAALAAMLSLVGASSISHQAIRDSPLLGRPYLRRNWSRHVTKSATPATTAMIPASKKTFMRTEPVVISLLLSPGSVADLCDSPLIEQ